MDKFASKREEKKPDYTNHLHTSKLSKPKFKKHKNTVHLEPQFINHSATTKYTFLKHNMQPGFLVNFDRLNDVKTICKMGTLSDF